MTTTWIEIDGIRYGAEPDGRGPIGGGEGYQHIFTEGDFTCRTAEELIEALARATAGQVVFVPGNTEIDLTTLIHIEDLTLTIPSGVTLASDRGHDVGGRISQGGKITSRATGSPAHAGPEKAFYMIEAAGQAVRVSGLRIAGPIAEQYLDHRARSFNADGSFNRDYYRSFPIHAGIRTRNARLIVDNCVISGFSNAAVILSRESGHRVHHNCIHSCQYEGLGYGVSHGQGSSEVSYNLFRHNRHSIHGTGEPGCWYHAHNNVEAGFGVSHRFDMHAEDGVGGDQIIVERNTFLGDSIAVKIKGVPVMNSQVHGNWFLAHDADEADKAVVHVGNVEVSGNAYGPEIL